MSKAPLMMPQLQKQLAIKSYLELVRPDLERVDARIRAQSDAFDPGISGYVEYAAESSGKRLRPALVLMAAHATGRAGEEQIDLAVVIELIHLASLIHDDVLDNAEIRRARPTMNAKWGVELSVLLGDCLFAHALKLCTRFEDAAISRAVADAANEVCTGEILQTQRRYDLNLSVSDYLRIIGMKTAALFRISTELAGRLNRAPESMVDALRIYGESMGTAYQIYDDCLDLFGTESGSGKTLGTDLKKGKLTLPVLHTLQQIGGAERDRVSEALLHGNEADRAALQRRVVEMGGHRYSVRKAQELLEKAEKSLEVLPINDYSARMRTFARAFHKELDGLK
ncbi:MAG: polyprenyl synthetase family protein [Candidatus Methylacidiphilales bacterium]|nr:polyprenyl synthetase family protein [Candidatus Methylacidiphilales bacterium]